MLWLRKTSLREAPLAFTSTQYQIECCQGSSDTTTSTVKTITSLVISTKTHTEIKLTFQVDRFVIKLINIGDYFVICTMRVSDFGKITYLLLLLIAVSTMLVDIEKARSAGDIKKKRKKGF